MFFRSGLIVLLLVLAGCDAGHERAPAIGVAYVGPATLNLRKDIPLDSGTAATVKHGERLDIVRQRRVFYLVRTSKGVEGWANERVLLSSGEMEQLGELAERARKMPSLGAATTFDVLNVHTDANRQSPSFLQIKTGEKVDVLMHKAAPRVDLQREPLIPPIPKKPKTAKKKEERFPPLPAAPPPPANWLALSKTPVITAVQQAPPEPPPPVPMDDWDLVRTKSGETGWVLSRRLYMSIPDDVAQYAEGKRITSYFSLAEVQDGDQKKHDWLWTTISDGIHPYDFDSFRVFIWSLRRHRYETAYIERKVQGYLPIHLKQVQLGTAASTTWPGFEVCLQANDGQRYWRSYAFIVNVVRFAGQRPCEAPKPPAARPAAPAPVAVVQNTEKQARSLFTRFRLRLQALTARFRKK